MTDKQKSVETTLPAVPPQDELLIVREQRDYSPSAAKKFESAARYWADLHEDDDDKDSFLRYGCDDNQREVIFRFAEDYAANRQLHNPKTDATEAAAESRTQVPVAETAVGESRNGECEGVETTRPINETRTTPAPESRNAPEKCGEQYGGAVHPRLGLGRPICQREKGHSGEHNASVPVGQEFAPDPAAGDSRSSTSSEFPCDDCGRGAGRGEHSKTCPRRSSTTPPTKDDCICPETMVDTSCPWCMRGAVTEAPAQTADAVPDLYRLAYIPGVFRCPQCQFQLVRQTLSVARGAFGTTEKDRQSEPCPNDGTMLEHVTYKDMLNDYQKRLEEELTALQAERSRVSELLVAYKHVIHMHVKCCRSQSSFATDELQHELFLKDARKILNEKLLTEKELAGRAQQKRRTAAGIGIG